MHCCPLTKRRLSRLRSEAIRQANASLGVENKEQTLADIETKSKRIIKMIERAYRDIAAGNLSDDLLDEMMERFGKERQALEEQRQKPPRTPPEDQSIRNAYTLFFDIAKRCSHIEKLDRDILHTFIERIEIGEKILYRVRRLQALGPRAMGSIRIFYRFIGEMNGEPSVESTKQSIFKEVNTNPRWCLLTSKKSPQFCGE